MEFSTHEAVTVVNKAPEQENRERKRDHWEQRCGTATFLFAFLCLCFDFSLNVTNYLEM